MTRPLPLIAEEIRNVCDEMGDMYEEQAAIVLRRASNIREAYVVVHEAEDSEIVSKQKLAAQIIHGDMTINSMREQELMTKYRRLVTEHELIKGRESNA
jgi:hypothetical protein